MTMTMTIHEQFSPTYKLYYFRHSKIDPILTLKYLLSLGTNSFLEPGLSLNWTINMEKLEREDQIFPQYNLILDSVFIDSE